MDKEQMQRMKEGRVLASQRRKTTLRKDVQESVDTYLSTIPIKYQGPYKSGVVEGKSKASAIKAKCQNCVGYEEVITRVGDCKSYICPLWRFRPYQKHES